MTSIINLRQAFAVVFVVALAIGTIVPSAAAQSQTDPAFIVEFEADGSAEVSVRSTFDLTTDAERTAFQTLMDDEAARDAAQTRFFDRMQAVASDAANATGREMRISGATIDLQQTADSETGIVTLSVTWEGLAAVKGETLVVTEPFGSGLSLDRPLVLRAPDGYEMARTAPEPDAREDGQATWNAGTDLSGFTVELVPEATPSPTELPPGDDAQSDGQPGFGLLLTVAAILVALGATARYRTAR